MKEATRLLLRARVPLRNPALLEPNDDGLSTEYYRLMALMLREAILENEIYGKQLLKCVIGEVGENRWNFVYMVIALFTSEDPDNIQDSQSEIRNMSPCFLKLLCFGTAEIIRSGEWGNVWKWLESKES